MSRYIDADKLKKEGWHLVRERTNKHRSYKEGMDLDCVPTADVQEVRHGKWIRRKDENNNPYSVTLICPVCGFEIGTANDIYTMNYCPNCGVRMDGEVKG